MTVANNYHQFILTHIQTLSGMAAPDYEGFAIHYLGSDKPWYHLNTKSTLFIAKDFLKRYSLTHEEMEELITSLYHGQSCEEIVVAARLVAAQKLFRANLNLHLLEDWLSCVHGWAETDVLCQMAFDPDDLLDRWDAWKMLLKKFSVDENIHKRRASLVLLTKPVRKSPDPRLSALAFENTQRLKSETHILITKAVSWILRSLVAYHPQEVGEYLTANKDTLPKIAYREASNKLLTGRKYIRPLPKK